MLTANGTCSWDKKPLLLHFQLLLLLITTFIMYAAPCIAPISVLC